MNISHETTEQTDRRLRRVLGLATLDMDSATWWYQELGLPDFPASVRSDAIAVVRDADVWSQLVPVRPGDEPAEPVRIWTFHFPEGVDNSGFVGWLASHIKEATGSGVLVVCGQNSNAGGIYDHWGCPEAIADQVLETVRRLARPFTPAQYPKDAAPFGLELQVVSTGAAGDVGAGTKLFFEQDGRLASARYTGGKVALGLLVGLVAGETLDAHYVQVDTDGRVDAGHSTWEIGTGPDGQAVASERFAWDTRPGSGTNEYEQVVEAGVKNVSRRRRFRPETIPS